MQGKKVSEAAGPSRAEQISGLIDGELDSGSAQQLIALICQDAEARSAWTRLHLAGDALRSNEVAACHSQRFCARISAALRREATVLAPRATSLSAMRRYLTPGLALAASVAAISLVALPLLSPSIPDSSTTTAAGTMPQAASLPSDDAARRAATTVANARALDPYLAAHRELTASGGAFPRAKPYLRPAADQNEGR
jgi:negative regulator of sigma E activity